MIQEDRPAIILCGGRGTRISDVNPLLPKPMLPIGSRPILWHIMKIYASHGVSDFTLALGWLGEEIRRWILHQRALTSDFTVRLGAPDQVEYHGPHPEAGWRITCMDTGLDALTGTRARRAALRLEDGPVFVTYGDGVGDVDVTALLAFHRSHGRLATVTAVRPPGRFGELVLDGNRVVEFEEKAQASAGSINGGFMVFEREALLRYVPSDSDVMLEREPMSALAKDGQLMAWEHAGFWQPMDTPRERVLLDELWASGDAPWKVWADDGTPA
ncbi:MAG: glucose-1-phosphate cytidylyltransferase [Microthrixaceae bacterium]